MQTIVYTSHTAENHQLVAERIRRERPGLYLYEGCECLNPLFEAFLRGEVSFEGMRERQREAGFAARKNTGVIFEAVRELGPGVRIRGVESYELVRDRQVYWMENVQALAQAMHLDLPFYEGARKMVKTGQKPRDFSFEDVWATPFLFETSEKVIERFEGEQEELLHNMGVFVEKEIAGEGHVVKRIRELQEPDMFGYFGNAHRTISHLLAREGVDIPGEVVGDIVLPPDAKLWYLLKYERLGLDPGELRSGDEAQDCDPAKKQEYLELIPYWAGFEGFYREFSHPYLVRLFWSKKDTLRG